MSRLSSDSPVSVVGEGVPGAPPRETSVLGSGGPLVTALSFAILERARTGMTVPREDFRAAAI